MLRIGDLLDREGRRHLGSKPEADPLTEKDALQEAELLDVRLLATFATIGILIDLRGALQLGTGNTGVLVARGVRALNWHTDKRHARRRAHLVMESIPDPSAQTFRLLLGFTSDNELFLEAESAEFFEGHTAIGAAPTDYADYPDQFVDSNTPNWDSAFDIVHATFLDPYKEE